MYIVSITVASPIYEYADHPEITLLSKTFPRLWAVIQFLYSVNMLVCLKDTLWNKTKHCEQWVVFLSCVNGSGGENSDLNSLFLINV